MKRRGALFVLAGAVALVLAAGVAFAATVNCQVDIYCEGTDGPDELYGSDRRDEMDGRQGDDLLFGRRGRDELAGDSIDRPDSPPDGNDQLYGNIGDDFLKGYGGSDLLKGGAGADQIDVADLFFFDSNPGADTVIGGGGDDEIEAAQDGFMDTIDCGAGFDRVLGWDQGLDEIKMNCEIQNP